LLMKRIQRLIGAQMRPANRFTGLFAGVIALITVISIGAGAQILLQPSSSTDRQLGSVQPGSAQGDRAAEALLPTLQRESRDVDERAPKKAVEALGLLRQSGDESSMSAMRKPLRAQGELAPDRRVNQQDAAAELSRLYDEQKEDLLKQSLIIALAKLNNEQARAKLNEITRSENRYVLRERAMDELARLISADELDRLYDEQKEAQLKERLIIALAQLNDEQARAKLNEITRTENRFYLRERAMNELAQAIIVGQAQPVVR